MKKKAPASGFHRWRWRLLLLGLSFFLLLGAFRFSNVSTTLQMPVPSEVQIESQRSSSSSSEKLDEPSATRTIPKIAFLFLARNRLALDVVWDLFFKGAQEQMYSIYIHARPGFVYDSTNTPSAFFWNRQINDSIQVEWGEASMIDAERILLRKALEDPLISHFVLLSDSCIPLYSFSYIYKYITSSSKSFVDSFVETKNTRYNSRMYPSITQDKWRKGSQWFVLVRKHAEIVIADKTVIQTFYDHCKRDALPESGRKFGVSLYSRSDNDCVPDEHYIQTLLAIKGVEDETERRSTTYTLWKASDRGRQKDRWHPVTFRFGDVSAQTIKDIQGIHSIRYDTEGRTEWCSCNGVPRACYLFARKFSRGAVIRLIGDNETDFFRFAAGNISNTEIIEDNNSQVAISATTLRL